MDLAEQIMILEKTLGLDQKVSSINDFFFFSFQKLIV